MISHELRTPLTSIKGFAQLILREKVASESSKHFADTILAEVNRAIRTIDDAVDLFRLESGNCDLWIQPVDMGAICQSAIVSLRAQDPEGRIKNSLPESIPMVLADPRKLERIVISVLSSALRYSPGVTPLEICAETEGENLVLMVVDRGEGLAPEKYLHIFTLEGSDDGSDRYPKNSDSQDESISASGFGLYIGKRLVEALGGAMWVEGPEEGKGRAASFAFRLPIAR